MDFNDFTYLVLPAAFRGQMLVNWLLSAFPSDHYLKVLLQLNDWRVIIIQFCTHLLAAGVLRQLSDKKAQAEYLFRPDLMYYWTHTEAAIAAPITPGKLSTISWPPTLLPKDESDKQNGRPFSEESSARLEPETEVTELARKVNEQKQVISDLTADIDRLKQEKERSKTLADIQTLTSKVKADFESSSKMKASMQHKETSTATMGEPAQNVPREDKAVQCALITKTTVTVSNEPKSIQSKEESRKNVSTVKINNAGDGNEELLENCERMSSGETKKIESGKKSVAEVDASTTSRSISSNVEVISPPPKTINGQTPPKQEIVPTMNSPGQISSLESTEITCKESAFHPPFAQNGDSSKSHSNIGGSHGPPAPPQPLQPLHFDDITSSGSLKKSSSAPVSSAPTSLSTATSASQKPSPSSHPSSSEGSATTVPPAFIPPPPPPPPPPPVTEAEAGPLPSPAMVPVPPPPPPGMFPVPPPPPPGMFPAPPPPPPGMFPAPPPPPPGMFPIPPPPPPGMFPAPPPPPPGMVPGMISSTSATPPPPPPPGTGQTPAPLPAPPAGGWNAQRATFRKKPLVPPVPMKPLYWTRVVMPVEAEVEINKKKAVWVELKEPELENLDEFTKLFSRQVVDRKNTKKKVNKPTKANVIKVLDSKRSQNVGILSSSLHLDFTEIENAIYNFDTSVVNLESLQQIYDVRATDQELEAIRAAQVLQPDLLLDKPEQFLIELAEIPHFAERIACFMFQAEFTDNITGIESKLNNLKHICQLLMSSESLKTVLGIILALGNFMNGGNRQRGQADGFGLEILSKLKDVKSIDNSITLLHYIVRAYIKHCGDTPITEIPLPVPEPSDIDRASAVNFEDIDTQISKLKKNLDVCQVKMDKVTSASEENIQPFRDKMESFMISAQKQVSEEEESLEDCKQRFFSLVKFYHFQPKGGMKLDEVTPSDFFPYWGPFCSDFKDIWKKEQQKILKEKFKESKKKLEERKQQVKRVKKGEGGLKSQLQKLGEKMAKCPR